MYSLSFMLIAINNPKNNSAVVIYTCGTEICS